MVYVLVNFCKARILKFSSNDVCVLTVYFHPKHAGVDVAMRVWYKSGFKSNGSPTLPPLHPCLSTLHNFIYPFCQPEFVGSREQGAYLLTCHDNRDRQLRQARPLLPKNSIAAGPSWRRDLWFVISFHWKVSLVRLPSYSSPFCILLSHSLSSLLLDTVVASNERPVHKDAPICKRTLFAFHNPQP